LLTSPATILRDVALAAVAMVGLALIWGQAGATAAGAAVSAINYLFVWRAVTSTSGGALVVRILGAHVVALLLLAALVSRLPALPVLAGFCAPILAMGVRGFYGALRPHPPEHA
jgi:hypothetical protein